MKGDTKILKIKVETWVHNLFSPCILPPIIAKAHQEVWNEEWRDYGGFSFIPRQKTWPNLSSFAVCILVFRLLQSVYPPFMIFLRPFDIGLALQLHSSYRTFKSSWGSQCLSYSSFSCHFYQYILRTCIVLASLLAFIFMLTFNIC